MEEKILSTNFPESNTTRILTNESAKEELYHQMTRAWGFIPKEYISSATILHEVANERYPEKWQVQWRGMILSCAVLYALGLELVLKDIIYQINSEIIKKNKNFKTLRDAYSKQQHDIEKLLEQANQLLVDSGFEKIEVPINNIVIEAKHLLGNKRYPFPKNIELENLNLQTFGKNLAINFWPNDENIDKLRALCCICCSKMDEVWIEISQRKLQKNPKLILNSNKTVTHS